MLRAILTIVYIEYDFKTFHQFKQQHVERQKKGSDLALTVSFINDFEDQCFLGIPIRIQFQLIVFIPTVCMYMKTERQLIPIINL